MIRIAVGAALLLVLVTATPAGGHPSSCTGWASRLMPPPRIAVLDPRTGRVHSVGFRRYVAQVMASGEWPSRLPYQLLRAGALAVKQFAHYHALRGHWRGGRSRGRCYDVEGTTRDQLWRPYARPSPKQRRARDSVWTWSLRKPGGRFFLTGYRAGTARRCGSDANGWKLYATSAAHCARQGSSARRIIGRYFGPVHIRIKA